jgi:hypothetical protein
MLNTKEAWALFEKLSASERESEVYGLMEDSRTTKIDPLIRKFQGMALTQPVVSETHQVEQEILAQPSDGKKMPMSRISINAILNKLQNRLFTYLIFISPTFIHHFYLLIFDNMFISLLHNIKSIFSKINK